jgi:hypothetical protein
VRHPTLDLDAERRDVAELERVVLTRPDRLREILPNLRRVDVEGGREDDVAHVVSTEVDVHQAWDEFRRIGIPVVLGPLHEGRGAVADSDQGHSNLVHLPQRPVARSIFGAHLDEGLL